MKEDCDDDEARSPIFEFTGWLSPQRSMWKSEGKHHFLRLGCVDMIGH